MDAVIGQPVKSLTPSAKVIACWLAMHPRSHVTGAEIAAGTGFADARSIREHVSSLVAGGWLMVEGDHGSPLGSRYVLCREGKALDPPRDIGAGAPIHPGAPAPPRNGGSGVGGPLPLALSLSSRSDTSSLQLSGSLADTHASDARAREDSGAGECGFIEVALDTALRGLPGIKARYPGSRAGDGLHARTVLDCIDAVRGDTSRRDTASAWAAHFVREFRHRTMRNFALYAESRAANGGRPVEAAGRRQDTSPVAGTTPDALSKASAELAKKVAESRAVAVPAPIDIAATLRRAST